MNDEVAMQVQRNKVLIEEEQVEMWYRTFFCNDAWLLVQEVVALKNKINQFCASTVIMMYTNLHLWLVTIA